MRIKGVLGVSVQPFVHYKYTKCTGNTYYKKVESNMHFNRGKIIKQYNQLYCKTEVSIWPVPRVLMTHLLARWATREVSLGTFIRPNLNI